MKKTKQKRNKFVTILHAMYFWTFSLLKDLVEFGLWFYKNSILSKESFSALMLRKQKVPMRGVLVIPLWVVEWLLSCIILGFSMMFAFFLPIFALVWVVMAITFVLSPILLIFLKDLDMGALLVSLAGIPILFGFFWLFVRLTKKIIPGLKKVRKA